MNSFKACNSNSNRNNKNIEEKKTVKYFDLSDKSFPTLSVQNVQNVQNANTLNYKNATTAVEKIETVNDGEIKVNPGYVLIYRDSNRDFIYKYGEKTRWQLQHEHNEMKKEKYHDSDEYIFNKLINNWKLNKRIYDSLNGEGSYNDVYTMPNFKTGEEFLEDDNSDEEFEDTSD